MKVELKISKKASESIEKIANITTRLLDAQLANLTNYNPPRVAYASPVSMTSTMEEPTEEEKTVVEAWMKAMEPVITAEAMNVIKAEVQQMMLMGGNIKRVAKALKEGKKPKLVRKKEGRRDPLFLQIGDGVEDPIEEIYVFG